MKIEQEIKEKLEEMEKYINSVSRRSMLLESERITYCGTSGAIQILEWVLGKEKENER